MPATQMPCRAQCAAHTASAQASPRQPRSQLHTPMWLQFPWPEHESTQEGQPGVAMAERNIIMLSLDESESGGKDGTVTKEKENLAL